MTLEGARSRALPPLPLPCPPGAAGGNVISERNSASLPKISSPPKTDRSALDCLKAPDQYACIAHIIGRQLRPDERSLDAVAFPRRQRYRDEAAARHDSIPLHRGGRHHASLELHRPRLDRIGSWLRENVLAGADTSEHQLTNSGTAKLAMFLQLRAGIDCIACPAAVSDLVVVSRIWARRCPALTPGSPP